MKIWNSFDLPPQPRGNPHAVLLLAIVLCWAAFGPLLFLIYGNYVNMQQFGSLSALPAGQADAIRVAYYANALRIVGLGALAWLAGLVALAIMAWRARPMHGFDR